MNSDSKDESIQGKWFRINKNIKKRVTANYDKIKDWKLDPKGYFLINIDRKKKLLRVGYCVINKSNDRSTHEMVAEIYGKTAIEVLNGTSRQNNTMDQIFVKRGMSAGRS